MAKNKKSNRKNQRYTDTNSKNIGIAKCTELEIDDLIHNEQLGPQQQGRVVAQYGANLDVEDVDGKLHHCVRRRNLPSLVCGDHVIWRPAGQNISIVTKLNPRQSLLARPDYTNQLKPIAANIDQIFIVIAIKPEFDEDLINRYLVAAALTQISAKIVVNKVDLLNSNTESSIKKRLNIYQEIGYPIVYTCTKNRTGLVTLNPLLEDKTSIFVGQSGVGKSSLINTLIPNLNIRVGALSTATGLGKHTTTVSVLYRLESGGYLIDSPGIREFGLGHVQKPQIASGFIEFDAYIGQCKFNDCTHFKEPGCAIKKAVEHGHIYLARYESYKRISNTVGRR